MARRCLYYPFIHFRDEAWLKLSALYWDDVTRIVPRSYTPRDSKEVRLLEEAEVLRRVDPGAYEARVGQLFEILLRRYAAGLLRRYDVSRRESWPDNAERFSLKGARSSRSLAFIHGSKLEPALVEQLLKLKLAIRSHDTKWLGMHPAIVSAYMIALAAEISRRRGLCPMSDSARHLGASPAAVWTTWRARWWATWICPKSVALASTTTRQRSPRSASRSCCSERCCRSG
jgi:hypothetical protein